MHNKLLCKMVLIARHLYSFIVRVIDPFRLLFSSDLSPKMNHIVMSIPMVGIYREASFSFIKRLPAEIS